jgi:hypothetical protein
VYLEDAMEGFYADRSVRQRLIEFLGGDSLEHASCVYLTHSDGCPFDRRRLRPPCELDWFLDRGLDIARSLADTRSYLLHLDIEYVNFDDPGAAFVDPWRCFDLQEPVVKVIEGVLLEWGIRPLHLVTGQGHHFVWRIDQHSQAAQEIEALHLAPELIALCLQRLPPLLAGRIGQADQAFFAGVALLIEYVAHRIKEQAAKLCEVPVEITAVHVGPSSTGQREMISIDISEYGDPLHTRVIRMPFTHYRKPWVTGLVERLGIAEEVPAFKAIPLHEMDVRLAIKTRQVEQEVMDLARRACTRIPAQEMGTQHLIADYQASRLRRLHEHYYSTQHDAPERWPLTYGRTPLDVLPACVRSLLEYPNDRLLKPAGMQLVTRGLLAQGWHPRHIAGLIRSKFEDSAHGWGMDWSDYEAATRADFYTRLFSCLYLSGIDRLVDFNCTSTQEKGFCSHAYDGLCQLEPSRQTLISQLPYD